ncbi:hypothetical protein EVAR_14632_1 [Eumeta japonica]|uniref:Uncharacterized protein n=1 Tax=Eumeta variegata TaxID=151549 RepID=A0A4C1U1Z1_EUMVA|nr:hypothetical protein EVAR_14632_1 [Eumeta japonica]
MIVGETRERYGRSVTFGTPHSPAPVPLSGGGRGGKLKDPRRTWRGQWKRKVPRARSTSRRHLRRSSRRLIYVQPLQRLPNAPEHAGRAPLLSQKLIEAFESCALWSGSGRGGNGLGMQLRALKKSGRGPGRGRRGPGEINCFTA